jgi:glycerate-2-kinase
MMTETSAARTAKRYLIEDVSDHHVRRGEHRHAGAGLLQARVDGLQHGNGRVVTYGVGKIGCSIANEALERVSDAGDAAVVVQHEHIGKADEHKEIQEAGHIESLPALG